MPASGVRFSIASCVAWAPGLTTPDAWHSWAEQPFPITAAEEAGARQLPPMLRRRAGALGKMALEVAFQGLDGRSGVPAVFVSRHGDVARAVELLGELALGTPLSPTGFGLAVHNANAGLFSIARADRANHIALAAGASSVEHAVIEACGLLADGAPQVLVVVAERPLPEVFTAFEDCREQAHAFALLLTPPGDSDVYALSCGPADMVPNPAPAGMPASLQVLRFLLGAEARLERGAGMQHWTWCRHG